MIELKGPSVAATFDGCIVSVDCDADTLTIDRATAVDGAFDGNRLLTFTIGDLENPSFILLLVMGACLTAVGELTATNVVDAIGVPDSDGDEGRCAPSFIDPSLSNFPTFAFTGDVPKLIFRDAVSNAWYALNDPDLGQVLDIESNPVPVFTFIGDPFVTSFGDPNPRSAFERPFINEFEPNPFGPDPSSQQVELKGVAGRGMYGCIVIVDCDTSTLAIDRAETVSGTFDHKWASHCVHVRLGKPFIHSPSD
jgi:hypothetical protein